MQRLLIALCFGATAGLWAQPADYRLDPAQTKVAFTLADTLHTVHGTFKLKHGDIQFDPATGSISGAVVVDAASGASGNTGRDSRMRQKILESARYPEIVFRPDRLEGNVAQDGGSDVRVHGMFSIHGSDHELMVPAHVVISGGTFSAHLAFKVPYVEWGMKNPSLLLLRVGDRVDISVDAVGLDSSVSTASAPVH